MTLVLVGLSHHVAPVELRERVTLELDAASSLARSLGDAVCLSTCNRTEVYLDGSDEQAAVDALMAVTALTWLVYGGYLAARPVGRRGAYVAIAGFALVILVRIALAGSHF